MRPETLGQLCSLATAVCWAVSVILFKKSGDALGPLALNMFKNVIGLALLLATCAVFGFSRGEATLEHMAGLALSGAVGIGVADTLLFYGLNQIGASRQAVVDTLYSPSVVVLSFFWLDEVLSPLDALGGALILGAVLLASLPSGRQLELEPARMRRGVIASALSMILMAAAIVAVKPLLERHDVLFCTTLRLLGGTFALGLAAATSAARRREVYDAFVGRAHLRYALPGAVLGTYFSILLWIFAFKYAPANVAALLNQTSTLFIVLLAAAFLNERLTPRLLVAVALALAGSLVVLA